MKTSIKTLRVVVPVLTALLLLCGLNHLHGANATWSGTTSGDWTVSTNWGNATSVPTTGETATFSNSVNTTVTVDAGRNIQSISFTGNTTGNFTFQTGSFVLGNNGTISMASNLVANTSEIFTANMTLSSTANSTYNYTLATTGSLQLQLASITGAQSSGGISTINFGGSGGTTATGNKGIVINGTVGDGASGGKVAVFKSGATNLFFLGNSTFTGATTLTAGTTYIAGTGGTLSGTSGITVSGGARLQIGDSNTAANNNSVIDRITNTIPLTLGGPVSGTTTLGGNLRMAAAAAGFTHAQTISTLALGLGANTIDSTGTGATALGNLTISGYSRVIGSVLTTTAATGFNLNFNISGSNVVDGIVVGAISSNNAYIGTGTNVTTNATVNNNWSPGNNTVASSNQSFSGNTTSLVFAGANTAITLAAGTNVINTGMIANQGGAFTGSISGGDLTSGNGVDLIFLGSNAAYGMVVNSKIVDNGVTPIGVTIAQTGALTLNGTNTYTGNTVLLKNVTVGSNTALGNGTVVFAGGTLSANTPVSLANTLSTANVAGTIAGSQNVTLTGNITGSNGLTVSNTGITTLSGNNTGLTAAVTVNSGATVNLGSANAAGTAAVSVTAGGILGLGNATGPSGGVTIAAATSTVTSTDSTARSFAISGGPSAATFGTAGTGDLTITSLGTFGANAFTWTVNNAYTTLGATPTGGSSNTPTSFTKNGTGTLVFIVNDVFNKANSTITINGGSLQMGNGSTTGQFGVTNNQTVTGAANTGVIINRSNAVASSSNFTGSLGITQMGAGNTTLSGTNTYSGNTTVSAGTLILSGNSFSANSSVINVAGGATLNVSAVSGGFNLGSSQTLKGNGTVLGNTTISGSLQPGNSPGLLTVNGTLTLNGTAITTMEIAGAGTRGTAYDAVDVTSSLTYGGNLTIAIGTTFATGNYTFDLFNFSSQSGNFTNVALTGNYNYLLNNLGSGTWGLTSGNETWTFTQSDGVLGLNVVPEPATWALLAFSLTTVMVLRRRRNS
ncbi:MAG: autotransporter-associated beta strand repeat-containing protein [Verrucomicrobiota bacterium]